MCARAMLGTCQKHRDKYESYKQKSLGRCGQQARPEGASLSSVLQSEPQKQSSVLTAEFVKGCESRMKLQKGTSVGRVSEKVRD